MTEIPSVLKKILATKAEELAVRKARQGLEQLRAMARDLPPARGFAQRLADAAQVGPAVIAEVKKASPSAGMIREDFQPAQIAARYQSAGAACLSVLTDEHYFKGADEHLRQAREACSLPALRKDFILDPWQVCESRVLGADCLLLIVAGLSRDQLQELDGLAGELGMDVLVEVHSAGEMADALTTDAGLVGINNRDLHTFTTDLETSVRLAPLVPGDRLVVTESGIQSRVDVDRMIGHGIRAFLVGEAFMRAADPGEALRSLFFEGEAA